jgi:ATP-binding cassette subfamily F protein uup
LGFLFDSISFGLDQGEKLGVIGKMDAGQNTLLNIIANTEFPDEGNVVYLTTAFILNI